MEILNSHPPSKWVIDYPMRNILRGQLIPFQPKGEPMLNIKGKRRPRGGRHTLGAKKIGLDSSTSAAVNCCETREEEEKP